MTHEELLRRLRQSETSWKDWAAKARDIEAVGLPNAHTSAADAVRILEAHSRAIMIVEEFFRQRGAA